MADPSRNCCMYQSPGSNVGEDIVTRGVRELESRKFFSGDDAYFLLADTSLLQINPTSLGLVSEPERCGRRTIDACWRRVRGSGRARALAGGLLHLFSYRPFLCLDTLRALAMLMCRSQPTTTTSSPTPDPTESRNGI